MPRMEMMLYGLLSHFMLLWCLCFLSCFLVTAQVQCPICLTWKERRSNGYRVCWPCEKTQRDNETPSAASSSSSSAPSPAAAAASSTPSAVSVPASASPPPPLFDSPATPHSHLSVGQRWAIITLHKEGHNDSYVSQRIPCDVKSVRRWIVHYELHQTVEDEPRSGRPRITGEETDTAIAGSAYV